MTSAVVFAPDARGHFARLRPVIAGLAERGVTTHVFTGRAFAEDVERLGGRFVDLFGPYPVAAADDESIPVVSRWVTYAAHYADDVIRDVAALAPSLVVYDTFVVIARVVANALGIPAVNAVSGHDPVPERLLAGLAVDPRVATSDRCLRAVEVLREQHGIADASPFSYADGLSEHLNLVCEPPEWMPAASRAVFEPAAFIGSLPPVLGDARPSLFGEGTPKVYASLGTVPWWYWPEQALATLHAVAAAVAATPGAEAVLTLGGADVDATGLERPGVRVERYADSWLALRDADVFVTSNGLNSTHEAIHHRVPMISRPFFWDQPALARRCAELGLAVTLEADDVGAALAAVEQRRPQMLAALERAREWEHAVVARRGAVMDRLVALAAQA